MADVTTTVGQWVLVWNVTDGLVIAMQHTGETSSLSTIEIFDTEDELITRVAALGYEMPDRGDEE